MEDVCLMTRQLYNPDVFSECLQTYGTVHPLLEQQLSERHSSEYAHISASIVSIDVPVQSHRETEAEQTYDYVACKRAQEKQN